MDENVEALVTYLPQGIVHIILSRLPAKSLFRFRSVCKNWCNMIYELDHIIVTQLMAKVMLIYPTADFRSRLFLKLNNNGIDCTSSFVRKDIWVEKACKNFVLFRSESAVFGRKLFVYDAINHQYRQLPAIPELNLYPEDTCSLVYDAFARTSKVVVLHYDLHNTYSFYSLNHGSENWRTLSYPYSQEILESYSPIDLNGVLYWKAEDDYRGTFIHPLDVATEKLMNIIKVPYQPWSIHCNLLKIKGSLCFMNSAGIDVLQIWVLKDSVKSLWVQQHEISLSSMVHRPISFRSFLHYGFHPRLVVEGSRTIHILVTIDGISAPFWYNMETKELSQIAVDCNNLEAYDLRTISFIDFDMDLVPKLEDLVPELEVLIPDYKQQRMREMDHIGELKHQRRMLLYKRRRLLCWRV